MILNFINRQRHVEIENQIDRYSCVGAAANVKNADRKLAELQGRNDEVLSTDPMNDTAQFKPVYTEAEKSDMSIHVQGHKSDFVHTVIGWNKPTGGNNSEGTSTIGEWKNMIGNPATVHSCYGVGNADCGDKKYWNTEVSNENNLPVWVPVYKPSLNNE